MLLCMMSLRLRSVGLRGIGESPTQFQTIIYASSDTSNVGDHDGDMSEMNSTSKLHFSIYFPIGKLHFSIYFSIEKLHFSI